MSSNMDWLTRARQKREEEKNKSNSTGSEGWLERARKKREEEKKNANPEVVSSTLATNVNNWLQNHNTYVSDYQNRFSGRKGNYEDAYVSDSASWLDKVSKQKSSFDAEADSILAYMDQYKGYLDAKWMDDVRKTIAVARDQQKGIYDSAVSDNQWWSSFGSEDLVKQYGSAEEAYKYYQRGDGYNKKYEGKTLDELQTALDAIPDGEEKDWLAYNMTSLAKGTLSKNADWAERSKYKSTYRGGEKFNAFSGMYTDTGYDDITYDYINRDEKARKRQLVNDIASDASFLGLDTSYLKEMTDDEIAVYNYLYDPNDTTAADKYLAGLLSDLNYRQRETQQKYWSDYAKEHPVLSSGFSVLTSPLKGLSAIGQFADYAADGTVDQNAAYNKFSYAPSTIREQVSSDIATPQNGVWGEIGSWTYQLGMGMGDFLVNSALSGGSSAFSLALMGSGAMADTVISAKDRGLSDDQAMILGVVAGAAEIVTEKFSLDALFKGNMTRGAMRYILTNALTEGTEEVGSSVINLLADVLVSKDKSEWQMQVQNYINKNPGATEQQAFWKVLGDTTLSLGLDFVGGALMGGVMGTAGAGINYITDGRSGLEVNQDAVNQYGGQTDALIQEGLGNDKKSDSYYLAQKYQKQVQGKNGKGGKALTGAQIRNLLAANQEQVTANDMQLIQQAAEKRLAKLGQKTDVSKIAELATRYATGGKLTKAERSFLVNSEYGPQVTSEMLDPGQEYDNLLSKWENDMSVDAPVEFSRDWIENVGTKSVNRAAYDKTAYEAEQQAKAEEAVRTIVEHMKSSMEESASMTSNDQQVISQLEEQATTKVAEDGVTIQASTGNEITPQKIVSIDGGEAMIQTDSGTISANDIAFGDEKTDLLWRGAASFTGITPQSANGIIRAYMGNEPVSTYLRGAAQEFQNGYYNKNSGGVYADKLTPGQREIIYALGQKSAGENTAKAQAKAKAAKKAAASKTGKVGKVHFEFDRKGRTFDAVRETALTTMEQLSAALGVEFYVYESYRNAAKELVYKDASGNEVHAPNGYYDPSDGSIHIDLNAGATGKGTMLFTVAHELTHFIKQWSPAKFKVLANVLVKQYSKNGATVDSLVEAQLTKAKNNKKELTWDEAFEEVVADSMESILTSGNVVQAMAEVKKQDKGLWKKICDWFKDLAAKLRAVTEAYKNYKPDSKEGKMVAEMRDVIAELEKVYTEALVEAGDNFQAAMESVVEKNAKPVEAVEIVTDGAVVTNGEGDRFSIRSMKHDIAEGKMFEDLKNVCGWTDAQVTTLRTQLKDLVEYMIPYREILDMNESYGMEGRRFSPYKPNSDPLYKISMDFSTLCSKRLLTQYVIENLQLRENRPMSAEEQMAIRDMLNEYRKVEKGLQVACAMCYVEAARLKSPKQIQRWLSNPEPYLVNYFAQKNTEFNATVKEAQADFKESRGYDRNAPKKDMKPADVKELNKIGPKMRSQYQLNAEERAIVERAKSLPNSTYLTAGNLATLSENEPVIYAAYTSFVRTATRSKSLETDEPYYYGDSARDNGNGIVVSDSFIEAVNRENGMRFSSWSDWRIQHLLDYITAVVDNSVRGAAMHGYTKFGDEVRVLGKTGMMFNMSGVTGTQTGLNEDGSLNFSDTESIDVNEAMQLRKEFPETAGLQCIGVGNEHIIALLASDIIDYVIPYHVSGLNADLRRMAKIYGWADYTGTQNASIDKSIKLEDAVDKEHWHEEPVFSEFFVGYDTGMSGIEAMRASAEKYKQMCKDRGLKPKFEQFATEDNYWKLLIDRKMINQQTGNLIRQKAVTPTFDFNTIKGVVDKFVDNYDAGLEARALNHIVENWDSIPQRIKDLKKKGGTKAKKTTKAVNTLANQTVAAQPKDGVKNSDRGTAERDQAYMAAVERGDMETVKKLVYEAAKQAGYTEEKFHGTHAKFNSFDMSMSRFGNSGFGFYFGDEGTAAEYGGDNQLRVFLNTNRIATSDDHKITARQFMTAISRLGLDASKTYKHYVDSATEYVRKRNDWNIAYDLQRWATNPQWYGKTKSKKLNAGEILSILQETLGIDGIANNRETVIWDNKLIKIADPVTYDDSGNVIPLSERFKQENNDIRYSDRAYMDAVEHGDMETVKKLVYEAAKKAGYTVSGHHGTNAMFNKFSPDFMGRNGLAFGPGFYFTTRRGTASSYEDSGGRIIDAYLKVEKSLSPDEKTMSYSQMRKFAKALAKVSKNQKISALTTLSLYSGSYTDIDIINNLWYKARDDIRHEDFFGLLRETLGYDSVKADFEGANETFYVVFNADQIKSSDPVTYDDSGNVIPLSERFKKENNDIRYSDRDPEQQKVTRLLEKENADLKEDVAHLRELVKLQSQVTDGTKFTKTSVEAAAGNLIKSINAKGDKKELAKLLNGVYEYIANGEEITFEGIKEEAQAAVNWLTSRVQADETPEGYSYDDELFSQEVMRQVYDSYWNVSTLRTVADKYQKQINQLKYEHSKRMSALREYHKEKTAKLKKEHKEKLQRVRQEYRDRMDKQYKDITERYRESRKKREESREKTELRHKIRKAVRDLDKILNRGNKKRNVKEDMKDFVAYALASAEILFTDNYSSEDMIRNGVETQVDAKENRLIEETQRLLRQRDDLYSVGAVKDELDDVIAGDTSSYDKRMEMSEELDKKIAKNMSALRSVFERERARINSASVSGILDGLAKAYKELGTSDNLYVRNAVDENVYQHLRSMSERMDGAIVKDMNLSQLEDLYKAYTMVLHTVRSANQLFVQGKTESIEQMAGRIMGDFSKRKAPEGTAATVLRNLSNKIGWDYEKLYYALDRIGSEAFTELVMNIANSENIVMQDVKEAAAFRDEMVKKYGFNNWDVNKKIDREFLDNTGKKFNLTLGQMMALYAYSRREGAWDHIEYGGFVFGERELTNPRPADSYKLTKEQCEAITDLLTKEQKSYVEDMQKFLSETMGEKGNEVSMMLYGIKMFTEKNYFPIHIAGQFKAQAQESQAKAAAGFSSMTNAGFTHAQNPNAKAPFVLEGFNEIWVDHVNEMSRYHGTVPALEDMRRVMNRSSYSEAGEESMALKQMMENAYGKEAVDYFDNLYREANSGAITDKLQKPSKWLLSMFRKNSVAYSLSVLVQQPASLARAYSLIDKKYFGFKGFGTITSGVAKAVSDKWTKAHTNAYNEMLKYAPGVTMAKEIGGFDTATGGSIRSYLLDTGKSLKQKWKTGTAAEKGKAVLDLVDDNAIANLPNLADKIAWIEIWNACKREAVAKHKNLAPNSEEFMQAVGERFTEVIRATQVYDSIFAKSPMLKSKNLAVQYLVSFMNEPNTVANMAESAVREATKGNWKGGLRTAGVLIHSIIFTNVMKSIIYAMRDDDEDETYTEKYIEAVAGNMMSDFNPLNYIPVARDVVSLAQGYDVERADMAVVSDAIDALTSVIKNATKETDGMTEEQLVAFDKKVTEANWKLVETLASFFGIPVKNIRREIMGVINHAKIAHANVGKTTAHSAWEKAIESAANSIPFVQTSKAKQDKLYEAIISGDKTYVARLKAGYKDDAAYNSAVRKALRENDPRIHEAAQARYNGNIAECKRIYNEIKNEGNFSPNDILEAINSEESKIRNEEKPETVSSSYSSTDFVNAVIVGDTSLAATMKDDIISAKVANGKSKEEAEEAFISSVSTATRNAFDSSLLDEAGAKKMLLEYADMDEEEADSKVRYWAMAKAYPQHRDDLSEARVEKYNEFAKPAGISLDVFVQYLRGTSGLETKYDKWGDVEESVRDQVLAVIDSLPITWEQKDALYLAAGYAESNIWDVPW